jgi:thiol-disulfide isomerase/thioredoxin
MSESLSECNANPVAGETEVATLPQLPSILTLNLPWTHFQNKEGQPASLKSLRRPLVLFTFSSSWCAPSLALAPTIASIYQHYSDPGKCVLDVVYVGLDYKREEHEKQNRLPYYRFSWNSQVPEEVKTACENPFWMLHWQILRGLGKGMSLLPFFTCVT